MNRTALPNAARLGAADRLDRRYGATWTRAQSAKNWALRHLVRAVLFVADRLPPRLLCALGKLAGRAAHALLPGARAAAQDRAEANGARARAPEIARDCFAFAGENLAICALLRRPRVRALDYVTVSEASRAVLTSALSLGRGAIVVSAHLGPFELIAACVAELGLSPAVVVRESYDPALDGVVDAHRRARGVDVIHRGKVGAALRVVRALRRGQPVGMLPDLGGRGLPALPVRFLGRTVAFPTGPQRIALVARCPIVVGTLCRADPTGGRSRPPQLASRLLPPVLASLGSSAVDSFFGDDAPRRCGTTGNGGRSRPPQLASRLLPPVLASLGSSAVDSFFGDDAPRRCGTTGSAPFELCFEALDRTGNLATLTQRVAAALARAVERAPADWLWMAPPHLAIADDSDSSLFSSTVHHSEPERV